MDIKVEQPKLTSFPTLPPYHSQDVPMLSFSATFSSFINFSTKPNIFHQETQSFFSNRDFSNTEHFVQYEASNFVRQTTELETHYNIPNNYYDNLHTSYPEQSQHSMQYMSNKDYHTPYQKGKKVFTIIREGVPVGGKKIFQTLLI